jgi:hypothetical protein
MTALWVSLAASAQTAPPAPSADASAKTFPAEFFSSFNPVTAEDMVRRLPGFTLENGEDRRGFAGAAGNVLINGERPSSKAPLAEQLSRISARDVLRIDIYAGGSGEADLRGQTLLADVRLRPRDAGATNTLTAQVSRLDPSGSLNPLIIATSAFRVGPGQLSLSLQAQPSRRGRIDFDKTVTGPTGALIERGDEFLQGRYFEYKLNARGGWQPSETDSINLNAQITPSRDGRTTFSRTFAPSGALLRTDDSDVRGDDVWSGEIGGDWERRTGPSTSFKLIGLSSRKASGSNETYTTRFPTGALRRTLIARAASSGETLGRGVFTWRPGDEHTVEFGGEAAFNHLDSKLDISVDTGAGPAPANIPVADTRIEERRGEIYLSDFWKISDRLKVESSLTVEASRISQTGDASQERDFTYVKPRLNATYDPEGPDQFRLLLERDVAQLDFTEFASAVSLFDGTVDLGNPDLEPEQTWRTRIDWERRFGAKGVLSVSLFHDAVESVQDQIPIAGQFDGPGNLGDGVRTGVKIDATAPLDAIGLKKGELRITGTAQKTRVDDPVTGLSRRFSGEPEWSYGIDYRQPLPEWKLLFGVLYERSDDVRLFRLKEIRTTQWAEANIDLFAETTVIPGWVLRASISEILKPLEIRERAFFSPDRTSPGNLSRTETRLASGGYGTRSLSIRLAGRF